MQIQGNIESMSSSLSNGSMNSYAMSARVYVGNLEMRKKIVNFKEKKSKEMSREKIEPFFIIEDTNSSKYLKKRE